MNERQKPSVSSAYDHGCAVVLRARRHVDDPVSFTYWKNDEWTVPVENDDVPPVVVVESFPAAPVFTVTYAPGTLVRFCALPIGTDGASTVWCALVVHGTQYVVTPVDGEVSAALDDLVRVRAGDA